MFARGLGWMFLGAAVGVSEGVAARSLGKLSYGTAGGTLGGFIGGAFFGGLYLMTRDLGAGASLWGAVGLVILGACIGSLSALVQGVFQPASVKVMRGWQEGREYPLEKNANLLGRDEHADIALFRDMKVEKHHARSSAKATPTSWSTTTRRRNGPASTTSRWPAGGPCSDGDRIQLGNVLLRFQMRAAQARGEGPGVRGQRKALAPATPGPSPHGIRR